MKKLVCMVFALVLTLTLCSCMLPRFGTTNIVGGNAATAPENTFDWQEEAEKEISNLPNFTDTVKFVNKYLSSDEVKDVKKMMAEIQLCCKEFSGETFCDKLYEILDEHVDTLKVYTNVTDYALLDATDTDLVIAGIESSDISRLNIDVTILRGDFITWRISWLDENASAESCEKEARSMINDCFNTFFAQSLE